MNGSRYRFSLMIGLALVLSFGAAGCSKKNETATTTGSSAPTTTAKGGTGTTVKATTDSKKAGGMCGVWPPAATGEPSAMKQADSAGFFVWQDVTGWHLRARGTTSKEPFKGTIRGSRDMTSVKESPVGGGTKVELKGNVVTFEIPASADLKGFDLVAGCAVDQLQFALLVGSNPAPADAIFVGAQGKAVNAVFIEQKIT